MSFSKYNILPFNATNLFLGIRSPNRRSSHQLANMYADDPCITGAHKLSRDSWSFPGLAQEKEHRV